MGLVKNFEPLKVSVFLRILAGVAVIMKKWRKTVGAPAFSGTSQQTARTCVKSIRAPAARTYQRESPRD
jgi:hypothetical protein